MPTAKRKTMKYLPVLYFMMFLVFCVPVMAQTPEEDSVKPLHEILNPPTDGVVTPGKSKLPVDYAKDYYNSCMNREHNVYTKEQQELACTCTAAKMSESLSLKQLQTLQKDNMEGKDARDTFLAYSYAPCMKHVIKEVIRADCFQSEPVKRVVSGKSAVCQCAVDQLDKLVGEMMPSIIIDIVREYPMTLDPMEYYFISEDYARQSRGYFSSCTYDHFYRKKYN